MVNSRSNSVVDLPVKDTSVSDASTHLQDLFRQFLASVDTEAPSRDLDSSLEDHEEVVEVRYNGRRYALVRYPPDIPTPTVSLSPREKEIVRLVAKGLPNKSIAAILDISPWTIATHLRRVFAKLNISSRAEMIARVMHDGLLALPSACEIDDV